MTRVAIKVTGAQGQGVNSVGEIVGKGLKRAGYCVFGYREYNSLIKGGHSSYQIDVSNERVESTTEKVDVLVCFNHHGLELNTHEVADGGIILHQTPDWTFPKAIAASLKERNVTLVELTTDAILKEINAKPILGNVLVTSVVWSLLGQDQKALKTLVGEQFAKKKDLLELNYLCIEKGFQFKERAIPGSSVALPSADSAWKDCLLLTGSQAMGLGVVHAGVRFYAGYPMTPSSPLLTYVADIQNETGMAIKQAEDEITAVQMASGAMHMGTRALTGTSGGGFDLMTETLSLNAMIENPSVIVLAQRPGPATGLPTWTGQGDLHLAVFSGHGEFPRCVVSASDAEDSFRLVNDAFNLAEEYQIPVILMTDKQLAEAIITQPPYDQKKARINRGRLVTGTRELGSLASADRYDPLAKGGISARWLPGSKAPTYVAQGDEHRADGSVDEGAENARLQMEKRMKKSQVLKAALPEPVLFGHQEPDLLVVSWGSNKGVILDALADPLLAKKRIGYLHYTYLWPLKTDRLEELMHAAQKTLVIECNHESQLRKLIRMESGLDIPTSVLKYDGRPFFFGELRDILLSQLP